MGLVPSTISKGDLRRSFATCGNVVLWYPGVWLLSVGILFTSQREVERSMPRVLRIHYEGHKNFSGLC